MTDGWDERTEAIPGHKGDKSFELELDFDEDVELEETQALQRPTVVVFEPAPIGLAHALSVLGYSVQKGVTGVDVMGLVASQAPAVVVCAPAPDPERRRLLAAALRLRFPGLPVIYVSTHARQEEAVVGAVREGARAVIAWPLPASEDVARVLGPYVQADGALAVDEDAMVTPPRPLTRPRDLRRPPPRGAGTLVEKTAPASSEDASFEDVATQVTSPPPPPELPASALRPMPVSLPSNRNLLLGSDEPNTQPNLRPAAVVAEEAAADKRGEIGQLLAAVSPFLWSLEDAARWAEGLADAGDSAARNHARAMHLLAKILAQLQARIDETGA